MTALVHVVCVDGELVALVLAPARSMEGLTDAERAVVDLAVEGLTNVEIATRRGTSVATVVNQLGAVYRKLGVPGRRGLRGGPRGA